MRAPGSAPHRGSVTGDPAGASNGPSLLTVSPPSAILTAPVFSGHGPPGLKIGLLRAPFLSPCSSKAGPRCDPCAQVWRVFYPLICLQEALCARPHRPPSWGIAGTWEPGLPSLWAWQRPGHSCRKPAFSPRGCDLLTAPVLGAAICTGFSR